MLKVILISFFSVLFLNQSYAFDKSSIEPSITTGVLTFSQRCILCHGTAGMGEGLLPMAIDNYPKTNLLEPKIAMTDEDLRKYIIWGGLGENRALYSPPWGNELSWTEIESLILFINFLRTDTEKAFALLKQQKEKNTQPQKKIGRIIYHDRCVRCHGKTGKGDGKMAKIIKNPPPFNLSTSIMPDEYLRQIISRGGAIMGRSHSMPPWGNELSATQLESVILYIKTLRVSP